MVGEDAAHARCREVDLIRMFLREESAHGGLVGEVQFAAGTQHQLNGRVACRRRTSADPTRAAVPRHEYTRLLYHSEYR